jgi:hypothetical protein
MVYVIFVGRAMKSWSKPRTTSHDDSNNAGKKIQLEVLEEEEK